MMSGMKKKVNPKLKERELTFQEWQDAMRVPTPHKNKKKYSRREKHKKDLDS